MAKHDLGDMEKIRATLQAWLRDRVPGAQELLLGELKFPEESGESSVSLILRASNQGEELGYVCRMKPPVSEVFDEHDLPLQYNLMKLAGDHGIPVPPLLGFEEDDSLVGSDFYVMGFVEGQVPTDNPPYAFGSWVTELSDEERATMWRNGLQTLASIHQIDIAAQNVQGIPEPAAGASPAQYEVDKFNQLITDEIRQRMSPALHAAVDYINDNVPVEGPRRLCWGDSRVGNVIWKDLKPNAVIDWEMASIGDPMLDVSWWYWIDYVNSVGLGVSRLGGLPSLQDIYRQWHEMTGLSIEHADFYDLFSVARYAIILELKFSAMRRAGLGDIDNFCFPFVEQQLQLCQSKAQEA